MKWFVYNVLFTIVYLAMMPFFLLLMKRRGGYRARMGDRFGKYPESVLRRLSTQQLLLDFSGTKRPNASSAFLWIHAVSVGEVQVAAQLIKALREKDMSIRFVFSTTSSTGWRTAEKLIGPEDVLIYNPLDFMGCVKRALDLVKPRAVILTETEIWPNFIRAIHQRGIPLYLVNARVSDRSAPRYRRLRWFFGEVLRMFTRIFAQSDLDARRLVDAGASPSSISVTGSFKFDVAHRNAAKEAELRAWIGEGEILLGGSTWPGEDEVLLRIYSALIKEHPEVRLVIAPRHFEKADAIEANILRAGFVCRRRSRELAQRECPTACDASCPGARPSVYLCDTTGEMMGLFGIATVCFVGKSLCAHGSQNMIEPCLCGVPTLVGPNTENFRPVMSDLLSAHAILQVPDEASLCRKIMELFSNPTARLVLGQRAKAAVARRCGVVGRCADELLGGFVKEIPDGEHDSVPAQGRRARHRLVAFAVFLLAYAISCPIVVPRLSHAWEYLQMDANRRYSTFVGLSSATILYPWSLPSAIRVCRGLQAKEVAGADEFGVMRFQMTESYRSMFEKAFPGHAMRSFNARFASLADLRAEQEDFLKQHGGYWLWCIGRWDYLFVARRGDDGAETILADRFIRNFSDQFELFMKAGIYSPIEFFACYVGDEHDLKPALSVVSWRDRILSAVLPLRLSFKPELRRGRAPVRASHIIPAKLPTVSWFVRGNADARIFFNFEDKIDDFQSARRELLKGFDLADAGSATNAITCWAAAAKLNPRDPLLLNLLDSLDLEGRRFLKIGNVNGAVRCYENRLLVCPHDVAAVHNFGVCLKKAGHHDVAAPIFARAVEMDPRTDAHRYELVECCAASGHEDVACRQLDVLLKRHPNDPALMIRAAKLLCLRKNKVRDVDRAVKLAEEAVRLTGWKDRAYVQALADVYIEVGRVALGMGLKRKIKEMRFDR